MKNVILRIITHIAVGMFMVFISAMDSVDLKIPIMGMIICLVWIILYYTANKDNVLKEV